MRLTQKKRGAIARSAIAQLKKAGKKNIKSYKHLGGNTVLRFHHLRRYYLYSPVSGRWCYERSANKPWRYCENVADLLCKIDEFTKWCDKKRESVDKLEWKPYRKKIGKSLYVDGK